MMLLSSSSGAERFEVLRKGEKSNFPEQNFDKLYYYSLSLSLSSVCLFWLIKKTPLITARDETCFSNREEGGTREKREAQTSAGFLMETDER
jgi:hypothetical protein